MSTAEILEMRNEMNALKIKVAHGAATAQVGQGKGGALPGADAKPGNVPPGATTKSSR